LEGQALLAVLEVAGRLIRVAVQVLELEEPEFQVKDLQAVPQMEQLTTPEGEAVELEQSDQTQQERLAVLAVLVLTLIQHGLPRLLLVLAGITQVVEEGEISLAELRVLVVLEVAEEQILMPLEPLEQQTLAVVAVQDLKQPLQLISMAALAVLEL
jgi:hypothetical protein